MAPIYQHLADGWPPKQIAASMGIGSDALGACLKRQRRASAKQAHRNKR
jgi:DNA-directed RNA polymerase specialized sigma24 family protein